MDVIINKELKSLLPPLSQEEYRILEESIVCEGCREPLLTWNGILVDGHNRYEICTRRGIFYYVNEIQAENIDDIKVWIIDNQKGRRNLTEGWKYELTQARKEILLKQGREKQKETLMRGDALPVLSTVDKTGGHNTQIEIAQELGWSTGKVAMADKVWKEAEPEIKEAIKKGDLTFNQVYQDIRKEERKNLRELKHFEVQKLPDGIFEIVYCDPPWQYDFAETDNRKIENQYPTMTVDEICSMQLPQIAEDALLLIWGTAPKLLEAIRVIAAWGFTYKTHCIWDKGKIGMGYWFRGQHELLLVATKGNFSPPSVDNRNPSIYKEERGIHSQKPKYFYEWIEASFGERKKVELFARNTRDGWSNWGNE